MTSHRLVVLPYVALLLSVVALAPHGLTTQTEPFDLVLAGGRVLDPETGLDATRNVGIREGRIAAVTVEPLEARETLDVHGLVVAPGFIDLHAHGQDSESYRYYAHDGVTTALELELGTYPVTSWYAAREGRSLINYGVSVGHVGARRALITHDESLPGAAAIGDKSRGSSASCGSPWGRSAWGSASPTRRVQAARRSSGCFGSRRATASRASSTYAKAAGIPP